MAIVVRKKDGTELVAARMPNASVTMEMAADEDRVDWYGTMRPFITHRIHQIRVTTDQEFYMYQPDFFRGKPTNEIDPPRKEIEK